MPGVGMTEGDVNAGNFFVLQNISDHVRAGGVGADREFADAIAVFIRAGVSAKLLEQFLVLAGKIDNAIVAYLDRDRRVAQIPVLSAEIIANHAVNDESSI